MAIATLGDDETENDVPPPKVDLELTAGVGAPRDYVEVSRGDVVKFVKRRKEYLINVRTESGIEVMRFIPVSVAARLFGPLKA